MTRQMVVSAEGEPTQAPCDLPEIDRAWLTWNNGTVKALATQILQGPEFFDTFSILADALEDAGCTDSYVLDHCRQHCRKWCWRHRRCWLLDHLLERDQLLFGVWHTNQFGISRVHEATAVNPGEWFGQCWMVWIEDCYDPPIYIVEAGNENDAVENFVESDFGRDLLILPGSPEWNDYGYTFNAGDKAGRHKFTELTYTDLDLNVVADERHSPNTTGQGEIYDDDNLRLEPATGHPLRYYGPGLPLGGVLPENVAWTSKCRTCGKTIWSGHIVVTCKAGVLKDQISVQTYQQCDYCSPECDKKDNPDLADDEAPG